MRLWQKIYLCVLAVFLITLDIGAFALLQKSYRLNLDMETDRGIKQFNNVEQTLSFMLENYEKANREPDRKEFIANFVKTYFDDKAMLEVYDEKQTLIYSNSCAFDGKRKELISEKIEPVFRKLNGRLCLFVGGKLDYSNLRLVLLSDVDYLQDYFKTLLRYFIIVSVILSIILSLFLIVLMRRLTGSIGRLNTAASQIASGAYGRRVQIDSKDEIGEFAANFNKMAEAVSGYIEELKESGEEKEAFINNLTHELKTPITAISGYSAFLKDTKCSEEERELAVQYILEHVRRLNGLSTKLMEVLYLKTEELCLKPVKLRDLLEYARKMEKHSLEKHGIALIIHCGTGSIMGDEILLQTLLMNLIENSIKASGEKSEIHLSSYHTEKGEVIEVTDYGVGIAKEEIDKITSPFYMVDPSRSKASGGIGLGLSICKLIVELHKGNLQVLSEKNKYTTVKLTFYN